MPKQIFYRVEPTAVLSCFSYGFASQYRHADRFKQNLGLNFFCIVIATAQARETRNNRTMCCLPFILVVCTLVIINQYQLDQFTVPLYVYIFLHLGYASPLSNLLYIIMCPPCEMTPSFLPFHTSCWQVQYLSTPTRRSSLRNLAHNSTQCKLCVHIYQNYSKFY